MKFSLGEPSSISFSLPKLQLPSSKNLNALSLTLRSPEKWSGDRLVKVREILLYQADYKKVQTIPRFMDHSQVESEKKVIPSAILRWALAILLPISLFLTLSFMAGSILILGPNFSITNPISLPSRCKIVSSRVDIRSSKICELGLFNYKAKNLFHPFERNKFHCRYDYYWASVFKVEYKDHFSSRTQVAFSEAPNEALPLYCRPNFGAALLTQYKFKVNESYDCWYASGISKVRLYQDDVFSCHADRPSTLEMFRRTIEMLYSGFTKRGGGNYWNWETIAGVVTGFSSSLISMTFLRFLYLLLSGLCRFCVTWIFPRPANIVHLRRACFFLAYCSFVAWLAIEYGKMLGLLDLVMSS
ncbi:uncharacterized protein LOC129311790 isoform X2 [Prosopis cineraria]|uniref:uncharacterized protein LOC129311790 isoform X2 n=1 Tax=Prosopis cineraria TaxID=364024 RepID=UPI00240EB6B5|nr:uncharacterized protein LOC129311790 isoform X2 [Prosopis cineraria]